MYDYSLYCRIALYFCRFLILQVFNLANFVNLQPFTKRIISTKIFDMRRSFNTLTARVLMDNIPGLSYRFRKEFFPRKIPLKWAFLCWQPQASADNSVTVRCVLDKPGLHAMPITNCVWRVCAANSHNYFHKMFKYRYLWRFRPSEILSIWYELNMCMH